MMSEHTPTPWAYRPLSHDDWGWIRDADGNLAATARDGRVYSDQFDEYRSAGPDPYEANAAFIVKAVNAHDLLMKALTDILDANYDFRNGLPDDWEGDPLQDACAAANEVIAAIKGQP